MQSYEKTLFFLLVIYLVELSFFVLALLNQVAVAVNINMEVLIQLDYALEGTAMLLYRRIGNIKAVGNLEIIFARKSVLKIWNC